MFSVGLSVAQHNDIINDTLQTCVCVVSFNGMICSICQQIITTLFKGGCSRKVDVEKDNC